MKIRDAIKVGSVVEVCVQSEGADHWCALIGTLGHVVGQRTWQNQHYWEVSFPLPQMDGYGYIWLYHEERPTVHELYQNAHLRKVHGKAPHPVTLVVARFADAAHYALYEVTRDERATYSPCELATVSCADLAVLALVPVQHVTQFCEERGWYLLSKEGDRTYGYTAELFWCKGDEVVQNIQANGAVMAATDEEAHQRALRVLLREYPRDERFSGHEGVVVAGPMTNIN